MPRYNPIVYLFYFNRRAQRSADFPISILLYTLNNFNSSVYIFALCLSSLTITNLIPLIYLRSHKHLSYFPLLFYSLNLVFTITLNNKIFSSYKFFTDVGTAHIWLLIKFIIFTIIGFSKLFILKNNYYK